jgi:hypothetical protein
MINNFKGKYYFLSNFYSAPVNVDGILYANNEAAFQASKALNMQERSTFANLNPSAAKRKGRRIKLRPDWEEVKEQIMYKICFEKFWQNSHLCDKLLQTENEHLEEGNTWGDKEWGTVNGQGKNKLGKILMQVRAAIRANR